MTCHLTLILLTALFLYRTYDISRNDIIKEQSQFSHEKVEKTKVQNMYQEEDAERASTICRVIEQQI